MAELGKQVVVLEAQTPGWGASGRNGGQVNPGLIENPNHAISKFGIDMGRRMIALSGDAGKLVFDLSLGMTSSVMRVPLVGCAPLIMLLRCEV